MPKAPAPLAALPVAALVSAGLLAACKPDFPAERAEACMVSATQDSTGKLLGAGKLLLSLSNDPEIKGFDIGSVALKDLRFGTCQGTGPDRFRCTVEYEVVLKGEGGAALSKLSTALGAPLEGKRLEDWDFRFGPTLAECQKAG